MPKKQITSFSIDWYNCGLCNPLDKVHERITIYLRKNLVRIEKLNGLNDLLSKREYIVHREDMNNLFDVIHQMDSDNKWKKDYSVMVCDGSSWKMRLRYSDRTVKHMMGTVEKADAGSEIEKMIKNMLLRVDCTETPILFGCSCKNKI